MAAERVKDEAALKRRDSDFEEADLTGINVELPILRSGYLQKQKKNGRIRKWQRRYFTLNEDALTYMKNPKDVPRGVIKTIDIQSCELAEHKKKPAIKITVPDREYLLASELDGDSAAWVEAILNAIKLREARAAGGGADVDEYDPSTLVGGYDASTMAFDPTDDDVVVAGSGADSFGESPFMRRLREQRELAAHNARPWGEMSKEELEAERDALTATYEKELADKTAIYEKLRLLAQETLDNNAA